MSSGIQFIIVRWVDQFCKFISTFLYCNRNLWWFAFFITFFQVLCELMSLIFKKVPLVHFTFVWESWFCYFWTYPLTCFINQKDPCPSSVSEQPELQGGAGCAKGWRIARKQGMSWRDPPQCWVLFWLFLRMRQREGVHERDETTL